MLLEGTLIFHEQQRTPTANEPMRMFNPDKLPKLPKRSR
jgi:hypothetical protein